MHCESSNSQVATDVAITVTFVSFIFSRACTAYRARRGIFGPGSAGKTHGRREREAPASRSVVWATTRQNGKSMRPPALARQVMRLCSHHRPSPYCLGLLPGLGALWNWSVVGDGIGNGADTGRPMTGGGGKLRAREAWFLARYRGHR